MLSASVVVRYPAVVRYAVSVPLLFDYVLSPVISESPSMRGFFYWPCPPCRHGIFGSGKSRNPLYIARVAEMVWGWVSVDYSTPIDSRWVLNVNALCDNPPIEEMRIHDDADPAQP